MFVALGLLAGCQNQADVRSVSSQTGDSAKPAQVRSGPPIRFALTAAFISEAGLGVYEKLLRYLEKKTGYPCELLTGLSYEEASRKLASGEAEVGFVCGLPYVLSQEQPNPPVRLMAAPIPAGPFYRKKPIYYSDIIVRADSPYQRVEDLKGCTWAYNNELSNSGYNLPRAYFIRNGLHKGFLGKIIRTGSHEESIRAVATGQADAAAVDSLVLDYERLRASEDALKVRVLKSLGPSGVVPVVVSRNMPEDRFRAVQKALLEMHQDPEGAAILKEAWLRAFVPANDAMYDDIRAALRLARQTGCEGLQM